MVLTVLKSTSIPVSWFQDGVLTETEPSLSRILSASETENSIS